MRGVKKRENHGRKRGGHGRSWRRGPLAGLLAAGCWLLARFPLLSFFLFFFLFSILILILILKEFRSAFLVLVLVLVLVLGFGIGDFSNSALDVSR